MVKFEIGITTLKKIIDHVELRWSLCQYIILLREAILVEFICSVQPPFNQFQSVTVFCFMNIFYIHFNKDILLYQQYVKKKFKSSILSNNNNLIH